MTEALTMIGTVAVALSGLALIYGLIAWIWATVDHGEVLVAQHKDALRRHNDLQMDIWRLGDRLRALETAKPKAGKK